MPLKEPKSSDELLERNALYAISHVPIKHYNPEKFANTVKMAIVSCLDSRVIPEVFCNLAVGEMTVIRCAGGRAKYAINDIVTLNALVGINEIVIIHHTDCGLAHVDDEFMREKITRQDPMEGKKVDVDGLTITSLYKSLQDDITWLRYHPLIKKDTKVTGLIFDIDDGSLKAVESITNLNYC